MSSQLLDSAPAPTHQAPAATPDAAQRIQGATTTRPRLVHAPVTGAGASTAVRRPSSAATGWVTAAAGPLRVSDGQCVLSQLNREWDALVTADAHRLVLARWGVLEPALAGIDSLAALSRSTSLVQPERADAVLLALLHRSHAGDRLATTAVIQLMLGVLVGLSKQHALREHWGPSTRGILLGVLVEVISDYPMHRTAKVAANLRWETHKAAHGLLRAETRDVPAGDGLALEILSAHERPEDRPYRGDVADPVEVLLAQEEDVPKPPLVDLLVAAVSSAVISAEEAEILTFVYGTDPTSEQDVSDDALSRRGPCRSAEAAQQWGISRAALRKRCSRAVQRLSVMVDGDEHRASVQVAA